MNRTAFLAFFFVLSSCFFGDPSRGGRSANVVVASVPYHPGSRIRIFQYGFREQQKCRNIPIRLKNIETALNNEDVMEAIFGEDWKERQAGDREEESNDPSTIEVKDGWMRFGLFIRNHDPHHLIITEIQFSAKAKHSRRVFTHRGTISDSYCDSQLPYLYLVPGKKEVSYKPNHHLPSHNLTIYLDGFTGPDSSGFSRDLRIEQPASGSIAFPSSGSASRQNLDSDVVIPSYRIELVLRGYFIDQTGQQSGSFRRTVRIPSTPPVRI